MGKGLDVLHDCVGFQWDDENIEKNKNKHDVTHTECEEVFFNTPIIISEDMGHSLHETRFHLFGKTNEGKKLFMVFTIRKESNTVITSSNKGGKIFTKMKKLIRVISARDMNKKEKAIYEQAEKNTDF